MECWAGTCIGGGAHEEIRGNGLQRQRGAQAAPERERAQPGHARPGQQRAQQLQARPPIQVTRLRLQVQHFSSMDGPLIRRVT